MQNHARCSLISAAVDWLRQPLSLIVGRHVAKWTAETPGSPKRRPEGALCQIVRMD